VLLSVPLSPPCLLIRAGHLGSDQDADVFKYLGSHQGAEFCSLYGVGRHVLHQDLFEQLLLWLLQWKLHDLRPVHDDWYRQLLLLFCDLHVVV
jgi:hypothetical protein